ncbi:MAG: thioredoxin [Glaciihabitans sp.]|nr:thioredoxin [Glaciihabitans sp.]MDQ1731811.1 thioredoxin 1 [Pseudonocardiales bacterium]
MPHTTTLTDTTDAAFADDVLSADRTVLVEFWAEWCPPCRALRPILEQIATEHPDTLRVITINADDNEETSLRYQALALPTMKIFRGGEVVKTIIGAKPKAALLAELAPWLA